MTEPRLYLRERAIRDVEAAVTFYRSNAGAAVALRFVDALERAYRHIGQHPEGGSPRLGHEMEMASLRSWPLKGFPFIVFYLRMEARLEVLRVLHGARDIPVSLQESDFTRRRS